MRFTFLGTGTSHGIPTIGCSCSVCRSSDPKNKRSRCGALLEVNGENWLIDTPTELRLQLLREEVVKVHRVFYTHAHADHILGLDDLRVFTHKQPLPIYGSKETLRTLKSSFPYAFHPPRQKGGVFPCLKSVTVKKEFEVNGQRIEPLEVHHGRLKILGYRFGPLAYITDASFLPPQTIQKLIGCRYLVLNALRFYPHATHFSLAQAVEVARQIEAKQVYFTHICHNMDHSSVNRVLPSTMELAYDGLSIEIKT